MRSDRWCENWEGLRTGMVRRVARILGLKVKYLGVRMGGSEVGCADLQSYLENGEKGGDVSSSLASPPFFRRKKESR